VASVYQISETGNVVGSIAISVTFVPKPPTSGGSSAAATSIQLILPNYWKTGFIGGETGSLHDYFTPDSEGRYWDEAGGPRFSFDYFGGLDMLVYNSTGGGTKIGVVWPRKGIPQYAVPTAFNPHDGSFWGSTVSAATAFKERSLSNNYDDSLLPSLGGSGGELTNTGWWNIAAVSRPADPQNNIAAIDGPAFVVKAPNGEGSRTWQAWGMEELVGGMSGDDIQWSELKPKHMANTGAIAGLLSEAATTKEQLVILLPIVFEVTHTEIDPVTNLVVDPGANTMLRDEIVDIRIKVLPIGTTDWTVDLTVEPTAMRNENLPNRGDVQMYDFGQIEADGTVTPDKTQFVLQGSSGGERIVRAVFCKEGKLNIRLRSTDADIHFISSEYTIQKRIRKYANLASSPNHDLNQHDKAFIDAATHWGAAYQHQVDDVERLKAMGMAESELGLTDATDILTVGNPGDHVLDAFRNFPPYDRFPGVSPLGGLALREVDIANNSTRILSYPAADETPAPTAIHWGVCWLYQKASSIQNNPNPPQPPNPPNPYVPGPWRSWDTATERYNGGGVPNYLQRINRSMREGRHPSNANLYIWPLKSDRKARGNQ